MQLCDYAWAGADEVFVLGSDSDWRGLEATVSRRTRCPVPELSLRLLADELPPGEGRTILLWGLRSGWMQRGERAAAAKFHRDIKTINRRLDAIGFPRIGSIIRHSILWHAAELQRRGKRILRHICRAMGLTDSHSLSRKRRTQERHRNDGVGADRLAALLAALE